MAKIVPMPATPLPMVYDGSIIMEFEILYYTILKADRETKKLTKLDLFKTITPTTDITEQTYQLYSRRNPGTLQTSIDKSFGSDGFLAKEKLSQEFVSIVDEMKLSGTDTEYPLYRVLLYHPLVEDEPIYMAHSYKTNVIVSHIAPDGRLMQYHIDFNIDGDMTPVAIDLSDEANSEPIGPGL